MLNRSRFVTSLLAAGALAAGTPPLAANNASPPELQRDLDQLWSALLAVGVYPFATSDQQAATDRYRALRASLREPLDPLRYVLKIAPLFGALNDGHVGVQPGAAYMAALAVPLRCVLAGPDLIVIASANGAIERGSALISVANVPADHIRDVTLAGWGGQTARLQFERFVSASRIVMSILAGDPAHYEVRWRTPAGVERRGALPRAAVALPWEQPPNDSYALKRLAGGSIGLIDYRRCIDLGAFQTFLRHAFSEIRRSGIRAVIVDIRHNSGGDSELNDALWQYLTAKSFSQYGSVVMRASDYLKARYGKTKYVEIYGIETWESPNGALITYPQSKIGLVEPRANALRFSGPVALLIGPRTFSSALDCAIAAKAYGLATVIGEETSEPVNTTGEVITVPARFTGITGSFTTKYYAPPNPLPLGRGVIPDIEVTTTLDDLLAGRDPVLRRAIRELRARFR